MINFRSINSICNSWQEVRLKRQKQGCLIKLPWQKQCIFLLSNLKICLNFNESQSIYAYQGCVYKTKSACLGRAYAKAIIFLPTLTLAFILPI